MSSKSARRLASCVGPILKDYAFHRREYVSKWITIDRMDWKLVDAFLSNQYLPPKFEYPSFYKRLVELNLTNLEPWRILHDHLLTQRAVGLKKRYPSRVLVPFARRVDSDDIACWDIDAGSGAISIVHDFADPGWEQKEEYGDITGWFRKAIEDLIDFE